MNIINFEVQIFFIEKQIYKLYNLSHNLINLEKTLALEHNSNNKLKSTLVKQQYYNFT